MECLDIIEWAFLQTLPDHLLLVKHPCPYLSCGQSGALVSQKTDFISRRVPRRRGYRNPKYLHVPHFKGDGAIKINIMEQVPTCKRKLGSKSS